VLENENTVLEVDQAVPENGRLRAGGAWEEGAKMRIKLGQFGSLRFG